MRPIGRLVGCEGNAIAQEAEKEGDDKDEKQRIVDARKSFDHRANRTTSLGVRVGGISRPPGSIKGKQRQRRPKDFSQSEDEKSQESEPSPTRFGSHRKQADGIH